MTQETNDALEAMRTAYEHLKIANEILEEENYHLIQNNEDLDSQITVLTHKLDNREDALEQKIQELQTSLHAARLELNHLKALGVKPAKGTWYCAPCGVSLANSSRAKHEQAIYHRVAAERRV
jgi:hypothetical protein